MSNRFTKVISFFFVVLYSTFLCSCRSLESTYTLVLLDDDTYSISSKDKINYGNNLILPSTFKGKKISTIAEGAFKNQNIKSVSIPNSIIKIGKEAFSNCNYLSEIKYNNKKQSFYCTFNDAPVGFDDNVECGANCFGDYSHLPSINTTDLVSNASFKIECNNINLLGDKIEYDIGYCKDNGIRSTGEFTIDSEHVSNTINAKVHGILKDAKFKISKNGEEKYSFTSRNIKVSAPEYNIAPLSGTFPVLLFSLQLKEITNNGTIPTYVALNRSKAYDWDNLMYNISYFPNVTKEQALVDMDWKPIKLFVVKYVRDLYKANPNSVFNFYYRDLNSEMVIESFICNGVSPDNIKLHILSDGTLTPGIFCSLFGIKDGGAKFDPNIKLETMKSDVNVALYYFHNKKWDYKKLIQMLHYPYIVEGFEGMDCMQSYSYAFRKVFKSSEFQTGRLSKNDNMANVYRNDPNFYDEIVSSCSIKNTNTLLNNLSDADKIAFKKMYKFSDDVFKESKEKGNDIVMVLGGAWTMEKNNFYAYLRMTMEYFGTFKTDYYYKPHPGHPTSSTPERKQQLDKLASEGLQLKELEGSIAAEIILFYEPSLQASGWPSTTFTSLENVNKGLALYDVTLASAKEHYQEYYKNFECFYSVATTELKQNHLFSNDDHVYLIEYNDSTEASPRAQQNYNKHPTALYNLEKNEFHYYKDGKEVER